MKLVLTGSTGYIGGQALTHCLQDARIDQVVVLSRRPLPNLDNVEKAKVVNMKDFNVYTPEVLADIEDADAAIWCVGSFNGDPIVEVDYPCSFYEAMTTSKHYQARSKPFRFVHIGGAFTVRDQTKWLWWMNDARKGCGLGESTVLSFADAAESKGRWESYVVKPGIIVPARKDANYAWQAARFVVGSDIFAWNDDVAATMIELALEGGQETSISSRTVHEMGSRLLAAARN